MRIIFGLLTAGLCLVCIPNSVFGQKILEKPYQKWTKDDALGLVMSSPWAVTYQNPLGTIGAEISQISRNQRDSATEGGNGDNGGARVRNSGPAPIVVRLHSGYPIRHAIARGRQIAAGYDKMDDKQKSDFDLSSKGFLDCAICKDYYVVSVTSLPDSNSQSLDEAIFQRSTLAELKELISLMNDKGEKRSLFQFNAPKKMGDSAYLFFARKDVSGKPLISEENKTFKLIFEGDFFNSKNPYAAQVPRSVEFKVAQITVKNEIVF